MYEKLTSQETVVVKSFSCINDSGCWDTLTAFCCVFIVFLNFFSPHPLFIYLFFYRQIISLKFIFFQPILFLPYIFYYLQFSLLRFSCTYFFFIPLTFLLYLIVSFSSYFVLHFFKALFFSRLVSRTLIFSPYISFSRIHVDALSRFHETVKKTRNLSNSWET